MPGLTAGIVDSFVNNHIRFTAWEPALSPFLTKNGNTVGLYGEFAGGGRIVLTGPDQDYHSDRGDIRRLARPGLAGRVARQPSTLRSRARDARM